MVVRRDPKIVGKVNQLLVELWVGKPIFDRLQELFGTKFDFRHVECKEVSFYDILDTIGWKHWKTYGKNWDISAFMEVVYCYELSRCQNRERTSKGGST